MEANQSAQSKGDGFHFFLNNEYQGSAIGDPAFLEQPISVEVGKNDIALISFNIGLPSAGGYYEWVGTGVTSANISGLSNGTLELSGYPWKYKVTLFFSLLLIHFMLSDCLFALELFRCNLVTEGESLKLSDGLHSANWATVESPPKYQPLTWYKIPVKLPSGHHPVGLDMIHMGKGQAWLNGYEIGRYWNTTTPSNAQCVEYCYYLGAFNQLKCGTGCGDTTQRWYHVPRSWFKPSGSVLVVFEEVGGDPTMITFSNHKISNVCTLMSEDHPPSVESWRLTNKKDDNAKATARLNGPDDAHISAVKFASFGNPEGECGFYSTGGCHDPRSASVVEKLCLGKRECLVELSKKNFDKGLCPGTVRKLAVEAVCS
ncbi:hypothetical protein Droror1_Dr00001815 [Drosera rotundifolia]